MSNFRLLCSAVVLAVLAIFAAPLNAQDGRADNLAANSAQNSSPHVRSTTNQSFFESASTPKQDSLATGDGDLFRADKLPFDGLDSPFKLRHKLESRVEDCLSIRSYVVERDSPQSDSTHPKSYSTCQPANRFQMKTADMVIVPADR